MMMMMMTMMMIIITATTTTIIMIMIVWKLTRVEVEEGAHQVVVQLAGVQDAEDERSKSTLACVGHGVCPGHVQRSKHCSTHTHTQQQL